jgi:PAS domain S-box-containing protein
VEDEAAHAELVRRAFDSVKDRFKITIVGSLHEARDFLSQSQPQLVITDLMLPDGRGIDLLSPHKDKASYPIVVLTGQGDERIAVEVMKAGAINYIVKSESVMAEMPQIAELSLREWHNIKEREKAEEALCEREKQYQTLVENLNVGVYRNSPGLQGRFIHANSAMAKIFCYDSVDDFLNILVVDTYQNPEDRRLFVEELIRKGSVRDKVLALRKKDGTPIWGSVSAILQYDEKGDIKWVDGIIEDITEQIKLEEQLRQSQKMEAVGTLAGGIAHDFNNLLTPILGYSGMLLAGFSSSDPRWPQLQEIIHAAERAKYLTHRLLAFSRKQMLELKVVDLGNIVRQFQAILQRTLRENINIEFRISPSAGLVHADMGQIEQVLINLAVNAQDAMPEGGMLIIETANLNLDESYSDKHPEIAPGPYVMLSVSDTGTGMDKQRMEHIFEPFYTTKEIGKGTGLGLSTVYGIVRQHAGSIHVYSEINHGTVFKIFLPRLKHEDESVEEYASMTVEVEHGSETIVLAEDDQIVRTIVCEMLKSLGYQVLTAENPDICFRIASEHQDEIDLLLTDVIMPGMNGIDLFKKLLQSRPGLKVIFMSGYTSDVVVHHGVLEQGLNFIKKPFSLNDLSGKIRQVLDS